MWHQSEKDKTDKSQMHKMQSHVSQQATIAFDSGMGEVNTTI